VFLVLVAKHWPEDAYLLSFLVGQFGSSIMIVIGGVLVRKNRSAFHVAPQVRNSG